MLYLLYKMGNFLSCVLPLKIAYRVAEILGSFYYFLARRDRKIVTNNIKVVLKRTGNLHRLSYISRMVFVNFARYLVEFFRTTKIDLKYIENYVTIIGKDKIDRLLDLGKGVILVSAHLGNWELGAMVFSMLGYRVNGIAWTHKNKLINDLFLKRRKSKAITIIPLGVGIKKAFSALKNNETVALLGDVSYNEPQSGIPIKFFGQKACIPQGPAVFSLKTGAPIMPTFMLRVKGNRFRLILEDPIIYEACNNWEYDLVGLTEKIIKKIEYYIARFPAQWSMFRPRWETIQ